MTSDKLDSALLGTPLPFASGARKSSFVITDIHRSDEEIDDVDTTLHSSLLVDQLDGSEGGESPKRSQILSWVSPPVVSGMSLTESYSRFRIVKIESRDRWYRGRWTCHDFADPPERVKTEQMVESDDNAASSINRNGPSIYYIPGAQDALRSPFGIVYNTGGHPVLGANLLPSSPKYARGSQFFSGSLPTLDDTSEDTPKSELSRVHFSSQRISAVDQREPVGHTAARKLFVNDESNTFMPLKVAVSESGHNNSEDTTGKSNESFVTRQLSSILLMTADAQKTTGQTSPLDVMMSATLGSSSSELDMRLVIVYLPLFAQHDEVFLLHQMCKLSCPSSFIYVFALDLLFCSAT